MILVEIAGIPGHVKGHNNVDIPRSFTGVFPAMFISKDVGVHESNMQYPMPQTLTTKKPGETKESVQAKYLLASLMPKTDKSRSRFVY